MATAAKLERCLAALCGDQGAPDPETLASESFRAAYRSIARLVPSRSRHGRANIAAVVHVAHGDPGRAIACLERSLTLEFNQYPFQALLAELLVSEGRWEAYSRKGEFGLEVVAALEGAAPPPVRYHPLLVGKVFDRLSGQYEERVLREGYAEHTRVAQALAKAARRSSRLRIADLGCGTGLLAEALHDMGLDPVLVGVDMSEAMLARARERGSYEALYQEDIERFVEGRLNEFDAAVLASVIPFFGELDALFRGVAGCLRSNGLVVFTHDITGDEPVEFNAHGRFRHGKAHVESRLAAAGMKLESSEPFTARFEGDRPVAAQVVVARRTEN